MVTTLHVKSTLTYSFSNWTFALGPLHPPSPPAPAGGGCPLVLSTQDCGFDGVQGGRETTWCVSVCMTYAHLTPRDALRVQSRCHKRQAFILLLWLNNIPVCVCVCVCVCPLFFIQTPISGCSGCVCALLIEMMLR